MCASGLLHLSPSCLDRLPILCRAADSLLLRHGAVQAPKWHLGSSTSRVQCCSPVLPSREGSSAALASAHRRWLCSASRCTSQPSLQLSRPPVAGTGSRRACLHGCNRPQHLPSRCQAPSLRPGSWTSHARNAEGSPCQPHHTGTAVPRTQPLVHPLSCAPPSAPNPNLTSTPSSAAPAPSPALGSTPPDPHWDLVERLASNLTQAQEHCLGHGQRSPTPQHQEFT